MNCRRRYALLLVLISLMPVTGPAAAADDGFAEERAGMIRAIEENVRETSLHLDKEAIGPAVMAAMGKVPRHLFVPVELMDVAYANRPLPIGYGQTISQPYIVAVMTDLLKVGKDDRVLEVGTGSGYQAAVLAELVKDVYTIEIIEALGVTAKSRLKLNRYHNVHVRIGYGYYGWEEHAPYDAIVVTAAAGHVPPSLIQQLKPGGRMMIPVGSRFMVQQLVLIEKTTQGTLTTRQILPVRFVPLTGSH
jgi:protein-L-isoaspartate(D-aspartate) O-methyltransferase